MNINTDTNIDIDIKMDMDTNIDIDIDIDIRIHIDVNTDANVDDTNARKQLSTHILFMTSMFDKSYKCKICRVLLRRQTRVILRWCVWPL